MKLAKKVARRIREAAYRRIARASRSVRQFDRLKQATQYRDGLPDVAPLNVEVDTGLSSVPTLNVLIPGMALRAMSGGPNTAINLTYRLAAEGIRVRFVSTDIAADENTAPLFQHFAQLTGLSASVANVSIVDASDRTKPLKIGVNDRFFASAWWNVQMIKRILPLTKEEQFFYIIQDFEPGLYAWSTRYALALETYSLNYKPIICSNLLAEYMFSRGVGRFSDAEFAKQALIFEPAIDRRKFHFTTGLLSENRRRLLFYARPTAGERNLFELGLYALRTATELGFFDDFEWEMLFIGEQIPEVALGRNFRIKSAPWLDYSHYAELMRSSDIVLSLMLSPHTSYPPLEAAASGAIAVTNTYANKTAVKLNALSPNIIGVSPDLEGVVDGLRAAADKVRKGLVASDAVNVPSTWEASFRPCIPPLIDALHDCRVQ